MLWGCFATGGTGALHKIDGIMREENYVDILKQHLKTSVRKLKLGRCDVEVRHWPRAAFGSLTHTHIYHSSLRHYTIS